MERKGQIEAHFGSVILKKAAVIALKRIMAGEPGDTLVHAIWLKQTRAGNGNIFKFLDLSNAVDAVMEEEGCVLFTLAELADLTDDIVTTIQVEMPFNQVWKLQVFLKQNVDKNITIKMIP